MFRQLYSNIDRIILVSAFLPYLLVNQGLRIEHLIVYAIGFILLTKGVLFKFISGPSTATLRMFMVIFVLVIISSIYNSFNLDETFVSNFENYTETLVLLLIFNSLLIHQRLFTIERVLRLNYLLHILLLINTGLILVEILTPYGDSFIQYYVKIGDDGYRVSTNNVGRYMGVFNLPIESGLAYSIGLMTWLFNFSRKRRKNLLLEGLLVTAILVGGLASVSKVFFLGGIPFFIIVFFLISKRKNKLIFGSLLVILSAFVIPIFFENWIGVKYLKELFSIIASDFSIGNISSGRIGGEESIYNIVFKNGYSLIFFGNGFTIGNLPHLDSEFVQIFYQGGGIALLIYIVILVKNFSVVACLKKYVLREKWLLSSIWLLGVMTAFGGPLFFMNRVRIILFIQLFFIYQLSHTKLIKRTIKRDKEFSPQLETS